MLFFCQKYFKQKIIIFLKDPNLIEGIFKNLKNHNNKSNFEVINVALGNENKEVEFLSVDTEKYDNSGVGSLFKNKFSQ